MNRNEVEFGQLPKKERRTLFKQEQAKVKQSEHRRTLLLKAGLVVLAAGLVIGLGYLVVTAKPADQSKSSSGLSSIGNLKLGDKAPDFSLPSTTGASVSLSQYKGKNVLLYFQEGVMCQPCWKQIGTMQRNIDKFKAIETEVVAIGIDTAADWGPVLKTEGVSSIPVLVDNERKMSTAYGVLNLPSQMHSDRPGHTFILVDRAGEIRWIADYPTMRVADQEVINSIGEALKKEI